LGNFRDEVHPEYAGLEEHEERNMHGVTMSRGKWVRRGSQMAREEQYEVRAALEDRGEEIRGRRRRRESVVTVVYAGSESAKSGDESEAEEAAPMRTRSDAK